MTFASMRTMSVSPAAARWCAMLEPTTPPPIITMFARPGRASCVESVKAEPLTDLSTSLSIMSLQKRRRRRVETS